MPRAFARVGNTHSPIVSLSFQSAKIDGRFKRSQPRSPFQLQPGRNSNVAECALWSGGQGPGWPTLDSPGPLQRLPVKNPSTDLLRPTGGASHRPARRETNLSPPVLSAVCWPKKTLGRGFCAASRMPPMRSRWHCRRRGYAPILVLSRLSANAALKVGTCCERKH